MTNTRSVTHLQSDTLPRRSAVRLEVHSAGLPAGIRLRVFSICGFVVNQQGSQVGLRLAHCAQTGVVPVFLALYTERTWTNHQNSKRPRPRAKSRNCHFLNLFKPPQPWDVLQVFFFMTGLFLADYSVYGFLPDILTLKGRGFNTTTYSLIYGSALFMAFLGCNFYGWLSDRTGRKSLTQWYCMFLVVFGIPVFYVLYHSEVDANNKYVTCITLL